MNPNSKTIDEYCLHLAIMDATADSAREAPWYGPWDLVLQNFLFVGFCKPPYFTVTYPQYPVSNSVDTDNAADLDQYDSDFDNDNDNNDGSRRSAAPSPEVFRGSRQLLPVTPPKASPDRSSRQPPKMRSTRIPDFVERLYEVAFNHQNSTISLPIRHRSRIILIVEIKKLLLSPTSYSFIPIYHQTAIQAHHVFLSSPATDTLGVIAAFGDFWTYIEYRRTDFNRQSPSFSEKQDPTYDDRSSSGSPETLWNDYEPFARLLHDNNYSCLRLETTASDEGLRIVHKRLFQLNLQQN